MRAGSLTPSRSADGEHGEIDFVTGRRCCRPVDAAGGHRWRGVSMSGPTCSQLPHVFEFHVGNTKQRVGLPPDSLFHLLFW